MILYLILVWIFSLAFAVYDSDVITKNHKWNKENPQGPIRKINHLIRSVIRFIVITGLAFILNIHTGHLIFNVLIGMTWFWIWFELFLNMSMGWYVFHIGTTASLDIAVRKVILWFNKNTSYEWMGIIFFVFKILFIVLLFFIKFWIFK
jgi:hypothetical protein